MVASRGKQVGTRKAELERNVASIVVSAGGAQSKVPFRISRPINTATTPKLCINDETGPK